MTQQTLTDEEIATRIKKCAMDMNALMDQAARQDVRVDVEVHTSSEVGFSVEVCVLGVRAFRLL